MTLTGTKLNFGQAAAEGSAHMRAGRFAEAAEMFALATRLQPGDERGWRALGHARRRGGDSAGAAAASLRAYAIAGRDPALAAAEQAFDAGQPTEAHALAAARLQADPTDLAALRLMGRLAMGTGQRDHAWDPLESTCRHASLSIL